MDIITELLDNAAYEIPLFSAIYSTLPVDYYIPPRNNEQIKEWLWAKHKIHF
jgi:hypothetical protein